MKNFLEALDINSTLEVKLSLKIIDDNGYPDFSLHLNKKTIDHNNQTQINFIDHVGHNEKIFIKIKMFGKKYSNLKKESAIIVENISIDDINVIPAFNHCIVYNNEKNKPTTTNYIGYNGDWHIHIDKPFYQWYHSVTGQGMLIKP